MKRQIIPEEPRYVYSMRDAGKMQVKVFWKTGLIISLILSVMATIIFNILLNH